MFQCVPFELEWECDFGEQNPGGLNWGYDTRGRGLLPKDLWDKWDEIKEFSVRTRDYEIAVKPQEGKFLTNGQTAFTVQPGKLVWYRQMAIEINTHDTNLRGMPRVNFYGLGLDTPQGRFGYRIYEDGRAEFGL